MADNGSETRTDTMADVLEAQKRAFLSDGAPSLKQRKARLAALRNAVLSHRSVIEEAISADFGNRSPYETGIMELSEVITAIDYLVKNLSKFMRREKRHVALTFEPSRAWVEYQPKGVIGIMAPWNYPFSLTMVPLATAIAAGNRAMLKPSELTPHTSDVIAQIVSQAFKPDEVAVVLGGAEIGAAFSALPFDHIFFTGSTAVGRKIMKAASENLVPVTLELGGKSPAVFERGQITDANVSSLVFGKLANAGQTCVAPDYTFVHEDDLESFIQKYDDTVRRFYPDGPTSPDYTTIINRNHFDRLNGLIASAQQSGARVLKIGKSPESEAARERTIAPVLVIDPPADLAVMEEEIFGPLLPVMSYKAIEEVIAFINSRPRPLALYWLGGNGNDRTELVGRTISGNVGINNTIMHVAQDDIPFGGVGASGMGAYHGIEGFRSMSHARGFYEQGRRSLARRLHAPFGKFADLALRTSLGRN